MSASVRELALRGIVAKLAGAGTPAANVFRSKLDQIEQAKLPCYDVTPGDEKVEDAGDFGDHESVSRILPVMVRAIVDAALAEGEDVVVGHLNVPAVDDAALDPFYVFAVQQLVGSDAKLGGLVDEVVEISHAPVFQPNGRDILGLEMTFELKFATKRGDPTQKG